MPPDRLRTRRLTRIVATLGPASDSIRVIRELVRAGMDVAATDTPASLAVTL